jgi:hypothetical protein
MRLLTESRGRYEIRYRGDQSRANGGTSSMTLITMRVTARRSFTALVMWT